MTIVAQKLWKLRPNEVFEAPILFFLKFPIQICIVTFIVILIFDWKMIAAD